MSCCGGKRRQMQQPTVMPQSLRRPAPVRGLDRSTVLFEYLGPTGLTVRGAATGRSYRFAATGSRVSVDRRDAPSLRAVPHLRMTG
jgi:hypothetical protein